MTKASEGVVMVMGTLTKYSPMFKVQTRDKKRASTELGSEAFMILSRKVKKQSYKNAGCRR